MGIIAVANHKGGVGKTATTLHLGAALGLQGFRALLIDLDPMGGLTSLLNVAPGPNVFLESVAPMRTAMPGVALIPGGPPLKASEAWLAARPYDTLAALLPPYEADFDLLLIDCPPQLDDFTKNAVVAADLALVPVSCDTQDLVSLTKLMDTLDALSRDYSVCERVAALITKFYNNRYSREFIEVVRQTVPRVLETPIRHSPVYQQAGGFGSSVFGYAPRNSIARKDYAQAAEELASLLSCSENGDGHGRFREPAARAASMPDSGPVPSSVAPRESHA